MTQLLDHVLYGRDHRLRWFYWNHMPASFGHNELALCRTVRRALIQLLLDSFGLGIILARVIGKFPPVVHYDQRPTSSVGGWQLILWCVLLVQCAFTYVPRMRNEISTEAMSGGMCACR